MADRTGSALRAAPGAGAAIVSRFGPISPAFAATCGASIDVGLGIGARNAQAREFTGAARRPRTGARHPALPVEIPTVRTLPPSRVGVAVVDADPRDPRPAPRLRAR